MREIEDGIGNPIKGWLVIRYRGCDLSADNRTEDVGFAFVV